MRIENIKFGYDKKKNVLDGVSCAFRKGKVTSIIGPNGCGKSTLLGLCTRLYKPFSGAVFLDGRDIAEYGGKEFAKKAASVYQLNEVFSSDITVRALVSYGRTPHKKMFEPLNDRDEKIIDYAIEKTGLKEFENRRAAALSGGERQRVFLATALAQEPEILFLDEPTSFLDIYYQLEIMEIVRAVNREKGVTVVMVLHDINQAVKYGDDILVMKDGRVAASGEAKTTVTSALIKDVFGVDAELVSKENGETLFAASL
ncbi:MAG: ABC transporter ATP-binding protein [Clostridiales bacterium]|jgi:iron complex transport system ATP-binding protein|nr:ABC transporter ATP-binding protein [Clostridiales bacterium]